LLVISFVFSSWFSTSGLSRDGDADAGADEWINRLPPETETAVESACCSDDDDGEVTVTVLTGLRRRPLDRPTSIDLL
jgi:hypothetical protein